MGGTDFISEIGTFQFSDQIAKCSLFANFEAMWQRPILITYDTFQH